LKYKNETAIFTIFVAYLPKREECPPLTEKELPETLHCSISGCC
jgi:hypothetical protein